jgi:hypothetical protein
MKRTSFKKHSSTQWRIIPVFTLLVLLASGALPSLVHQVHAQGPQPDEILRQLAQVTSLNIVDMQAMDNYPGSTAYIRGIGAGSAPDPSYYTNAAMVADLSAYGDEGGALWADAYAQNLYGCNVLEGTFHNLPAYSAECHSDNVYRQIVIWGMGRWGLATFNFLEGSGKSAVDLAEDLYQIILGLSGSSVPTPTQPAAQQSPGAGGTLTQKEATSMALAIMKGYAREIGYDEPEVYPGGFTNAYQAAGGEKQNTIFVMEAYSDGIGENVEQYVSSGAASEYRYNNWESADVTMWHSSDEQVIKAIYGYLQRTEWLSICVPINQEAYAFHNMPASYHHFDCGTDENEFLFWAAGHWLFQISSKPTGTPNVKQAADILYLLAVQQGMFNPPPITQPAPAQQPAPLQSAPEQPGEEPTVIPEWALPPQDPENLSEETLLDMMTYLTPAALLPALGVAGIGLLLDLLRRGRSLPPGMVNSPIPGYGPVSPDAAAYQQDMFKKGYQFDPNTRSFFLPKVKSPVDGSLVSRQQAEYEQNLLNQGYVYDATNDGFVTREWQTKREQRWNQFVSDRQAASNKARAETEERKRKKELEKQLRANVEQMEEQAQKDYRASQRLDNDTIGTLWAATQLTARTVVTGQDADGNVTLASFAASAGMRAGLAALTLGSSEYAYAAADFGYRTHDRMQEGMSFSEAATNSAAWMGVEYGGFWAGGKLIHLAASAKPTVWVANQIRSTGSAIGNIVRPLDSELAATLESAQRAVKSKDPEAIMSLFRNNGEKNLAELQTRGLLSPEETRTIANIKTNEVRNLVSEVTPEAMRSFDKANIKEVLIADSGSTSSRSFTPPKVNSDHDQAVLALFDQESITNRAKQLMQTEKPVRVLGSNRMEFLSENQARELAHNQYQAEFAQHHEAILNARLQERGLTTQDLDLKNYNGLGGDSHMADSYPAGYTRARMSNQGEAQVFRQNPNGNISSAKATGDYVVDREALHMSETTGANPEQAAQIIANRQPRITQNDAKGLLEQQKLAVSEPNVSPEKAAKAVARADKAQRILSGNPNLLGPKPPPLSNDLVQTARRTLSNPGQGNVPANFIPRSQAEIQVILNASQGL